MSTPFKPGDVVIFLGPVGRVCVPTLQAGKCYEVVRYGALRSGQAAMQLRAVGAEGRLPGMWAMYRFQRFSEYLAARDGGRS